jgi:hypothetical protein
VQVETKLLQIEMSRRNDRLAILASAVARKLLPDMATGRCIPPSI